MAVKHRLTPHQRVFFKLVNQAVFANPFTKERDELDCRIAGLSKAPSKEVLLEKTLATVVEKIDEIEKKGWADINCYSGQDRKIMETSFLFDFFHRFCGQFDQLITQQLGHPKKSLKVPFAPSAFRFLANRGFNDATITRYFALVYQLRRAFFFINHNLVGTSPCMKELRRKLWNNVFTQDLGLYNRYLLNRMEDFSTLLLGETGTGKGTAAAAIGRSGFIPFDEKTGCFVAGFTESFISLNLSQYPENLIESELFGHKKGAFTGAVDDFKGVLGRCSRHGAILLDEIGELTVSIQIKLLQVLQERIFTPVGSHRTQRFRGRIIAATNRPMSQLRGKDAMRDDFYYRLCSDIITVPSLKERIDQTPRELNQLIDLLVSRMLKNHSKEVARMVKTVIDRSLGTAYGWPGNVRELEQCVRAILLNRQYVPAHPSGGDVAQKSWLQAARTGSLSASKLLSGYCYTLFKKHKTYEAVARITQLDRRTAKKYIEEWKPSEL